MTTVGVVGAGKWGFNWVRTVARVPDIEFRWCCDLAEANLRRVQSQFPNVRTTSRLEDLLEDQTLDAVVVASSATTHATLAERLLDAGKSVMVEKPMTLETADADRLVALAAGKGLTLMVGHLMEYHPAIDYLCNMIDDDELGDIYYLYSQRLNLGTVRRDENAWWSLAPHDVSVACRLLREEPLSIQCRGQSVVTPNVHDVVFGTLEFPDGKLAHIHVSWLDPHKTRRLVVVGSKRMVCFDDTDPNHKITVYDKSVTVNDNAFESYAEWITMRQGDVIMPKIAGGEPLMIEAQHFLECVREGKTPLSDGVAGRRVVAALEAGQRSIEGQGTPVRLDECPAVATKVV